MLVVNELGFTHRIRRTSVSYIEEKNKTRCGIANTTRGEIDRQGHQGFMIRHIPHQAEQTESASAAYITESVFAIKGQTSEYDQLKPGV